MERILCQGPEKSALPFIFVSDRTVLSDSLSMGINVIFIFFFLLLHS